MARGINLLSTMAIPIYTPSRTDVEVGGRILLHHFIEEELLHQRIPSEMLETENPPPGTFQDVIPGAMHGEGDVADRAASPTFVTVPNGFKTGSFIEIGANIRNIADKFAQSHERSEIHSIANGVNLENINYSAFYQLLSELFVNGIDKYKIVSLFYFCSDVVIRCIKAELHRLGSKLFFWALQFLSRRVCKWIHDHGGWGRVFSSIFTVVYNVALLTALGVVISCGFIWIKNNK